MVRFRTILRDSLGYRLRARRRRHWLGVRDAEIRHRCYWLRVHHRDHALFLVHLFWDPSSLRYHRESALVPFARRIAGFGPFTAPAQPEGALRQPAFQ